MRVLAVADDLCTRKAGCVAGTGGSTGIAGGGGSFGRAMTDEEQLPSDLGLCTVTRLVRRYWRGMAVDRIV